MFFRLILQVLRSSLRLPTCALLLATLAQGQYETAAVLGTITDPAGLPITVGKVRLESVLTGVLLSGLTDSSGNYQFLTVRPGAYRVSVEAPGFKQAIVETFSVAVNSRQRVDLRLEVGDVKQSVVVRDAAALLESDSSDRGQLIQREAIVALPLNGRNYADLALLAPGVRRSSLTDAGREASFDVNGMQAQLNNFILDGVDNNAYGTSNQGFSNQVVQLSPDAVQEFKVQTDNFSAEYGRAMGAVVNVSIRSGTNQLHGSVFEFLRNTSLNAVGFFKPTGGVKPTYIQNQFGFSVGGPIRKDKMFFFGDYEGLRRVTRKLTFATIPTKEQSAGNFGTPIRNPYTNEIYSDGIIPKSVITRFATSVLNDIPAPNLPGLSNNLETLPRGSSQVDKGDARYDYYASQSVMVWARYSDRLASPFDPSSIPGPSGGLGIATRTRNMAGAVGGTWTITPTSVLDFRLGITKTEAGKAPVQIGGPNMFQLYGITGLPEDPGIAGGLSSQSISGIPLLGREQSSPQHQDPLVVNPKVNYSRVTGRHSLKAGLEYQLLNTEIDDFQPKYGQDTYSGQFTRPATGKSNNLYNIADFLFGARASYQLSNITLAQYRQRMYFGYVQDDFKVSRRLTLNLGLRYEYATPQWERDLHQANYDPATNSLVKAPGGSLYGRTQVQPDRNNFAPRVGFAYSATPKTVIRSAYGISYVHFNRLGSENLLAENGPFFVRVTISQLPSQPLCTANAAPTTCFRPTEMGYPIGLTDPKNFDSSVSKSIYSPADTRTSYVQSWHFTIQRQLAHDLVLDMAYVGNRGSKLLILGDYNQARPNKTGENLTLKERRPYPNFDLLQINYNGGWSDYHALQVKLEKRYSGGLYLLNSFTWSKGLDNTSGHMETANGDDKGVNYLDLRSNKGVSGYDQPLNDTATFVWALPFGHHQHFGSHVSPVVDAALGGWRLSGINTMNSGPPINFRYSPSAAFQVSNLSPPYRPNLIGNPMLPAGERTIDRYFNTAAIQIPTDVTHPFGNAGRNTGRGYAFYQLDFSLQKQFPLSETRRLEFRGELFNALNKTNFGSPDGNISNASFGTVRTTFAARQIQLALKVIF